ncbi:sigma-70 family RNA polymerase sigma factor [uncultured Arcticibacterium sp.]|uniref:RNA polymerase sigma factor n=1 Tax=uncultured Arcticibacterium sp. TaxID=2173042 RepID=UPI0030FC29E9
MNGKAINSEFFDLIEKCKNGERGAQRKLYTSHYGFAMSICLRYCKTKEEGEEVLNNAFLKVFKNLEKYDTSHSFKNWFKRILINASIDFYRSQQKHYYHQDINTAFSLKSNLQNAEGDIGHDELMCLVHELPMAYRTSFCLFAIDGFSHDEISKKLGISIGTSKSNVSRARKVLREKLVSISERSNIIK